MSRTETTRSRKYLIDTKITAGQLPHGDYYIVVSTPDGDDRRIKEEVSAMGRYDAKDVLSSGVWSRYYADGDAGAVSNMYNTWYKSDLFVFGSYIGSEEQQSNIHIITHLHGLGQIPSVRADDLDAIYNLTTVDGLRRSRSTPPYIIELRCSFGVTQYVFNLRAIANNDRETGGDLYDRLLSLANYPVLDEDAYYQCVESNEVASWSSNAHSMLYAAAKYRDIDVDAVDTDDANLLRTTRSIWQGNDGDTYTHHEPGGCVFFDLDKNPEAVKAIADYLCNGSN